MQVHICLLITLCLGHCHNRLPYIHMLCGEVYMYISMWHVGHFHSIIRAMAYIHMHGLEMGMQKSQSHLDPPLICTGHSSICTNPIFSPLYYSMHIFHLIVECKVGTMTSLWSHVMGSKSDFLVSVSLDTYPFKLLDKPWTRGLMYWVRSKIFSSPCHSIHIISNYQIPLWNEGREGGLNPWYYVLGSKPVFLASQLIRCHFIRQKERWGWTPTDLMDTLPQVSYIGLGQHTHTHTHRSVICLHAGSGSSVLNYVMYVCMHACMYVCMYVCNV